MRQPRKNKKSRKSIPVRINKSGKLNEKAKSFSLIDQELNEPKTFHEQEIDSNKSTAEISNKTSSKRIDPELAEIMKFIVPASRILKEKKPNIPYLVDTLFQQTGVVSIVGSSDTGKSSFLRQLATSIVHGDTDFLGFKINAKHKRVIYVSTEDDGINMAHLLALQNVNNIPAETYHGLGFIFDSDDHLKKIERTLKKFPADCVIIDAFADLFEGDMNQTNKVRSYLNKFAVLSVKYKCLFIFLHHTGKRTEYLEPSKNNTIGSQGFESKMRLMIELRKDFSDPTIRHMCIVKGNYLPEEFKDSSYVLKFENMRFSNQNRRVPFDQLGKPDAKPNIQKEKAIEYKMQGNSINKIVELLIADGFNAKRSTVANWISNLESEPVLYGYESDEPEIDNNSGHEPHE